MTAEELRRKLGSFGKSGKSSLLSALAGLVEAKTIAHRRKPKMELVTVAATVACSCWAA